MKHLLVILCLYEATAIESRRFPTVTRLVGDRRCRATTVIISLGLGWAWYHLLIERMVQP